MVLTLLCASRGWYPPSNAARISGNGARTAEIRVGARRYPGEPDGAERSEEATHEAPSWDAVFTMDDELKGLLEQLKKVNEHNYEQVDESAARRGRAGGTRRRRGVPRGYSVESRSIATRPRPSARTIRAEATASPARGAAAAATRITPRARTGSRTKLDRRGRRYEHEVKKWKKQIEGLEKRAAELEPRVEEMKAWDEKCRIEEERRAAEEAAAPKPAPEPEVEVEEEEAEPPPDEGDDEW